jgi:DNA-binding MarR family transcriptional regulator
MSGTTLRYQGINLREIVLSDNSNDYDLGSPDGRSKEGAKKFLTPQERRLQLENPAHQMAHMSKMANMRQKLEMDAMIEKEVRAEARRQSFEENLTPKQRRLRDERIQEENQRVAEIETKLNKEKAESFDIVNSFFDCSKEDFESFIADGHKLQESSVKHIIDNDTGHFICKIHEGQRLIKIPNHKQKYYWNEEAFVLSQIEEHIRNIDPEEHREEIKRLVEREFRDRLQEEVKNKPPTFDEKLAAIEKINIAPLGHQIQKRKKEKTQKELLKEFTDSL